MASYTAYEPYTLETVVCKYTVYWILIDEFKIVIVAQISTRITRRKVIK